MMPKHSDWRSAAAYEYLRDLAPAELAWEFLRRNPAYQREYRKAIRQGKCGEDALAERWGLRFRDRPGARSRPGRSVLAPASRSRPSFFSHPPPSSAANLARLAPTDEHVANDGVYLLVEIAIGRLPIVMMSGATTSMPVAALIPLDRNFPTRTASTHQLWRILNRAPPLRQPDPLTQQRRQRLSLSIRALDGWLANATYRELANSLFGAPRRSHE